MSQTTEHIIDNQQTEYRKKLAETIGVTFEEFEEIYGDHDLHEDTGQVEITFLKDADQKILDKISSVIDYCITVPAP